MSINKEQDFGTPASTASQLVTLEIDGFEVTAPAGTSIMRAAASIALTYRNCVQLIALNRLVPALALYRLKAPRHACVMHYTRVRRIESRYGKTKNWLKSAVALWSCISRITHWIA